MIARPNSPLRPYRARQLLARHRDTRGVAFGSMSAARELGVLGERFAALHFRRLGYDIVERNYRFGHREIDLIVRKGPVIAFVEVKARAGDGFGHPLAAITARKRREVERVARNWVQRNGRRGFSYRFDAVGVMVRPGAEPRIEHIPNAWLRGE